MTSLKQIRDKLSQIQLLTIIHPQFVILLFLHSGQDKPRHVLSLEPHPQLTTSTALHNVSVHVTVNNHFSSSHIRPPLFGWAWMNSLLTTYGKLVANLNRWKEVQLTWNQSNNKLSRQGEPHSNLWEFSIHTSAAHTVISYFRCSLVSAAAVA